MTLSIDSLADLSLDIRKEIEIDSPIDVAFQALLDQLGTETIREPNDPMQMVLEPWPGGRWYRDLGNRTGHLWAHVQVFKPPTLLELTGPLFMSYPVISHVQYRLTPRGEGVLLTLRHRAFGIVEPEHREGVRQGWAHQLEQVRGRAMVRRQTERE